MPFVIHNGCSMELFNKKRWRLVLAQLPNEFGYCLLLIAPNILSILKTPLVRKWVLHCKILMWEIIGGLTDISFFMAVDYQ